jgi:transcriptional regulator with XRE-family HTH domain
MNVLRNTVQGDDKLEEQKKKQRFIGPAILAYLTSKGISQSWLSRETGIGRGTMHDMLHGNRDIKAEEYFFICAALDLPVSHFEKEKEREDGAA